MIQRTYNIEHSQLENRGVKSYSKNNTSTSLPKEKKQKALSKQKLSSQKIVSSSLHLPKCFNTKGYFHNVQPYSMEYLKHKHAVFQKVSKLRAKKQMETMDHSTRQSINQRQKRHNTIDAGTNVKLMYQKSLQKGIQMMRLQFPSMGYYLLKGYKPKQKSTEKHQTDSQYQTIGFCSKAGKSLSRDKSINLRKTKTKRAKKINTNQHNIQNQQNCNTLQLINKIFNKKCFRKQSKYRFLQNYIKQKQQISSNRLNRQQQQLCEQKSDIQTMINKIKIKKDYKKYTQNPLKQSTNFFKTQVLIQDSRSANLMNILSFNSQEYEGTKIKQYKKLKNSHQRSAILVTKTRNTDTKSNRDMQSTKIMAKQNIYASVFTQN